MKLLIILAAVLVAFNSFAATGDNQNEIYEYCPTNQEYKDFVRLQEGDQLHIVSKGAKVAPHSRSPLYTKDGTMLVNSYNVVEDNSAGIVNAIRAVNMENFILEIKPGSQILTIGSTDPTIYRGHRAITPNGHSVDIFISFMDMESRLTVVDLLKQFPNSVKIVRNNRYLTVRDIPKGKDCQLIDLETKEAELQDVILEDGNRDT